MVVGAFAGRIVVGAFAGRIVVDAFAGKIVVGAFAGRILMGAFARRIVVGAFAGRFFNAEDNNIKIALFGDKKGYGGKIKDVLSGQNLYTRILYII